MTSKHRGLSYHKAHAANTCTIHEYLELSQSWEGYASLCFNQWAFWLPFPVVMGLATPRMLPSVKFSAMLQWPFYSGSSQSSEFLLGLEPFPQVAVWPPSCVETFLCTGMRGPARLLSHGRMGNAPLKKYQEAVQAFTPCNWSPHALF